MPTPRLTGSCFVAGFLFVAAYCGLGEMAGGGQTFEGPGGQLYYQATGSGAPLVVLHGGPGLDHTYLQIATPAWKMLSRKRRVIFYDQRGVGRSSPLKPGESCTLADQVADLEALRQHLGLQSMDLLGHSWGGYLAMAYAAEHPDRVAHMILVDSAPPKWSDNILLSDDVFPEATERREALGSASAKGEKTAPDASLRELFNTLFYSPEKRDLYLGQLATETYRDEVYKSITSSLDGVDLNPEIRKFRFPVLVVTGRFDMNVAPLVAYRIHQQIAGSRFVAFEHSGHFPFYEEPEPFVRVVEEFLSAK